MAWGCSNAHVWPCTVSTAQYGSADYLEPRMVVQIYFPDVYDIKYLMKFCSNLHGGLNKLAETLEVERVGPQHQVSLACLLQRPAIWACRG